MRLFSISSADICFSARGPAAAAFAAFFCSVSRCFCLFFHSLLLRNVRSDIGRRRDVVLELQADLPYSFSGDLVKVQIGHLPFCRFGHGCDGNGWGMFTLGLRFDIEKFKRRVTIHTSLGGRCCS